MKQHVKPNSGGAKQGERKCFKCGYEYPHSSVCPARDKTCKQCGEKGHFAKCCRGNKRVPMRNNKGGKAYQLNSSDGEEPKQTVETSKHGASDGY